MNLSQKFDHLMLKSLIFILKKTENEQALRQVLEKCFTPLLKLSLIYLSQSLTCEDIYVRHNHEQFLSQQESHLKG